VRLDLDEQVAVGARAGGADPAPVVPTDANSSPLRGTRTTRSASPTSMASVTVMVGKTTESSTGTSSIV
jgi:hypothetical protein